MDEILYQTDRILEIAGTMRANTENALADHEAAWIALDNSVTTLPWFMQDSMFQLLARLNPRFRASYQWQLEAVQALVNGVTSMEETDIALADNLEQ